jgi:hypothetical protein
MQREREAISRSEREEPFNGSEREKNHLKQRDRSLFTHQERGAISRS